MTPEDLENMDDAGKSSLYKTLRNIFKDVHSRFIYRKDIEVWDQLDHWETYEQIPDEGDIIGDCDCFAMACRKQCRALNIPTRLVYCLVKINGDWRGHLVLECVGFIFDCNRLDIVVTDDLPYRWISISGYEKGDSWHSLLK